MSLDYIDLWHVSGTFVYPPSIEGHITLSSGKEFLRLKFRLWPGRGTPIETVFKQEVLCALKALEYLKKSFFVFRQIGENSGDFLLDIGIFGCLR